MTVGFLFYAGKAVVDADDTIAKEEVIQRVKRNDDKVLIHVPLQKELGFIIRGEKKCFNSAGFSNEPLTSSFCHNGMCKIPVAFDGKVPNDVSIYVEKGNECTLETFNVGDKEEVVKLDMSPELLDLLKINEEQYDIGSLYSTGHSSYQIMGSKKVNLHYGKKVVLNDVLTINEQPKASIIFE